jgi:hypothetical protein
VLAAQVDGRPLAQFQVDATAAVLESLRSDGTQAAVRRTAVAVRIEGRQSWMPAEWNPAWPGVKIRSA